MHFELGGKNPVIVFDDADLDRALDAVLFMIYSLNGERCTSSSRALVQASIYEDFVKRLAERVRRIKVGHPLDPATEIGPLIHPRHLEKVLCLRRRGAGKEGATVAVGGGRAVEGDGNFVEPTLYTHARNEHADRAGGDLRSGADRDPVRRRGGGAVDRQRRALRPHRLHLDARRRRARTAWRRRSKPAWSG